MAADPRVTPALLDTLRRCEIRSAVWAPVRIEDEWLGVLCAYSFAQPRDWTDDDIRLLAETGTSVATNPANNATAAWGPTRVVDMLAAGVNVALGVVGAGGIDLATARYAARVCTRNAVDAVRKELGSLDRVARVLRLNVWVASAPGFAEQHLVADAATDYLLEIFGDAGRHARAALGVVALPTASPVEVDLLVEVSEL